MNKLIFQDRSLLVRALVAAGKGLEVGSRVEYLLEGVCSGVLTLLRTSPIALLVVGNLDRKKVHIELGLWGYGAFTGSKLQDPESLLTQSNAYAPVSMGDFYGSGATFSPTLAPKAKMGLTPSPEGMRLAQDSGKAMRSWVKGLPEEVKGEFRIRKQKARQ